MHTFQTPLGSSLRRYGPILVIVISGCATPAPKFFGDFSERPAAYKYIQVLSDFALFTLIPERRGIGGPWREFIDVVQNQHVGSVIVKEAGRNLERKGYVVSVNDVDCVGCIVADSTGTVRVRGQNQSLELDTNKFPLAKQPVYLDTRYSKLNGDALQHVFVALKYFLLQNSAPTAFAEAPQLRRDPSTTVLLFLSAVWWDPSQIRGLPYPIVSTVYVRMWLVDASSGRILWVDSREEKHAARGRDSFDESDLAPLVDSVISRLPSAHGKY